MVSSLPGCILVDMNFADLPTTEDFTEQDWREVLGYLCFDNDGATPPKARDCSTITEPAEWDVKVEEFSQVLFLYATTAGPGAICHDLDAVIVVEDLDGDWLLCEAWTDCTGWGCQDGVAWWAGTEEQIRRIITNEQASKLEEVGYIR